MAFINWDDRLSVKINSIDNQHKKLIELINQFYENIRNHSNNELISKLINGMKEYTIFHFENEEKYMKQFNYPHYDTHIVEHKKFLEKVTTLEEKFNNGKLIISFEITIFLKNWIKNHIQETDLQYSEFLIRNGVK